jgi:hypothetical protein
MACLNIRFAAETICLQSPGLAPFFGRLQMEALDFAFKISRTNNILYSK